MEKLRIYTDGGSRSNPGEAAIGYLIFDDSGKKIKERGEHIGIATNNYAEYLAVHQALKDALEIKEMARNITIDLFSDSQLVVRQLTGEFRVKSKTLLPLIFRIKELESSFFRVNYHLISRIKNAQADALVNRSLDQKGALDQLAEKP